MNSQKRLAGFSGHSPNAAALPGARSMRNTITRAAMAGVNIMAPATKLKRSSYSPSPSHRGSATAQASPKLMITK